MEFEHEIQKATYEKAKTMLREVFGEMLITHPEKPQFAVRAGTALVTVDVFPWSDDDAMIGVNAWVVRDIEPTPELMHFLLKKNNELRFGGFGMDEEGDIFFRYAIVGPTCDKEELKAAVLAVASTADRLDDEIVAKWGGQRALD